MHTPYWLGAFQTRKLAGLLRVNFNRRAIGIGYAKVTDSAMLDGFAVTIGQANRDPWAGNAIG